MPVTPATHPRLPPTTLPPDMNLYNLLPCLATAQTLLGRAGMLPGLPFPVLIVYLPQCRHCPKTQTSPSFPAPLPLVLCVTTVHCNFLPMCLWEDGRNSICGITHGLLFPSFCLLQWFPRPCQTEQFPTPSGLRSLDSFFPPLIARSPGQFPIPGGTEELHGSFLPSFQWVGGRI